MSALPAPETDALEDRSYNWRVTSRGHGDIKLDIGDDLSDLAGNVGDAPVVRAIGQGLIKLGTLLLSQSDDDLEEGWE